MRAGAFGAVLARCRADRGSKPHPIKIFAPSDVFSSPPEAKRGWIWLPHIFCWLTASEVSLAWELTSQGRLQDLVHADAAKVSKWSLLPELLIRLGRLAALSAGSDHAPEGHLSFRWLLANEVAAATALASERVALGHISLHVEPAKEDWIVQVLTSGIGLVEIPRPASISVAGRWLQCGNSRVHLNSRKANAGEAAFPGTAPNHVCFVVADLAAAERELRKQGVTTKRAGSLEQPQLWFRLPGGSFVELQPEP